MRHPKYGNLNSISAKTRGKCHICATKLDIRDHGLPVRLLGSRATPTIDHLLPRKWGGGNEHENLALACWSCNSRRRDRDAEVARYEARGTVAAPMSTTDLRVAQVVFGGSAAVFGGAAFAKRDAEGNRQFNAPAAFGCGVAAVLVLEFMF